MKLNLPLWILAVYPLGIFQSYLLGLKNFPTPTKVIPRYQKRTKSISASPRASLIVSVNHSKVLLDSELQAMKHM